ncbi:hypothetical protein Q2941_47140 [Bradyrhizobium sp. UFLA05-153]
MELKDILCQIHSNHRILQFSVLSSSWFKYHIGTMPSVRIPAMVISGTGDGDQGFQ